MKFLKTAKQLKSGSLRAVLHNRMGYSDPPRPRLHIHASELTRSGKDEFCPRYWAMLDIDKQKGAPFSVDVCLDYTFTLGNVVADALIEKHLRDIAVGDWRCLYCDHLHEFTTRPDTCHCGCRHFKYVECRFKDPSGASCGIDLMIRLPGSDKLTIVELKSMEKNMFRDLKAPLVEHRERTNLYLSIIERSNDPRASYIDTEVGRVFYMIKGHGAKDTTLMSEGIHGVLSPFKEYKVKHNPKHSVTYLHRAHQYNQFRSTGLLPDRIRDTHTDERCKACPKAKKCWSDEYPPGDTMDLSLIGMLTKEEWDNG